MPEYFIIDHIKELTVDADGSPRAYAFDRRDEGKALDIKPNATEDLTYSGNWDKRVVAFKQEKPYVQQDGKNKGMMLSKTPLIMRPLKPGEQKDTLYDAEAFCDPEIYPYVVMQLSNQYGMKLGDFLYVENKSMGLYSFAVFADTHGKRQKNCTEASLKLIQNLGSPAVRAYNTTFSGDFTFILFPKSGFNYKCLSPTIMDTMGRILMGGRLKPHIEEYNKTLFAKNSSHIPPVFVSERIKRR